MNTLSHLETVFFGALEKGSPAECAAYLDEACDGDGILRERVERMLKAQANAGDFLETPARVMDATLIEPVAETFGTVIGRYRLLEQIGEGGFGVVFMAEQEEPIRRTVAMKIVKPGMDTKEVISRFTVERQALALMDHPNIARVLDAGTTESGRPYFVMELVQGVSITEHCDRNRLNVRQRLELFVTVCQAVQHAHQKGVIHRDIKPGNVLITSHDGRPLAKVIDFGIAKAISRKLTDETLFTAHDLMIGTPQYMSPEQAAMSGLDVDTRSDVYSLGVLLYELLTGTTPLDRQRVRELAYDEIRRMICEEEPPKPSSRVSAREAESTGVSDARRTDPKRLGATLRGDLDWIAMKALEKDRTRRYETAAGLASDIGHYLNQEPVAACPPSPSYRLAKFARRNKVALLTAGAVAVALILGLVGSTWQAVRATKAERLAQEESNRSRTEADRAQAVVALLSEMLESANPDKAKGANYTVRELLDDFSQNLDVQLQGQPEVEATVRATIGNAYRRLALPDQAAPHLRAALDLRRRVFGNEHAMVAESLLDCAFNCWEKDRQSEEAVALAREALAIYRTLGGRSEEMISALRHLQLFLGNSPEGKAAAQEALTIAEASQIGEHPDIAIILHNWAQMEVANRDYARAEALGRKALEMHRQVHGSEHPETAWALNALANALKAQGKSDEAAAYYREGIRIFNRQYGGSYRGAEAAMKGLTQILQSRGDNIALEAMWREVLAIRQEQFGPEHVKVGAALCGLASVLSSQGRHQQAEPYCRDAIAVLEKTATQTDERTELARALIDYGNLLEVQGQPLDARVYFERALGVLDVLGEGVGGDEDESPATRSNLETMLGSSHLHLKNYDEALTHLARAVELNPSNGWAHLLRSAAFLDTDHYEEALGSADRAVRQAGGWCSYKYRADAYRAFQRYDEALADYGRAEEKCGDAFSICGSRAEVYLATQAYEKALVDLEKAVEIRPAWTHGYRCLASVHYHLGRYDDALADIRQAVDLEPGTWVNGFLERLDPNMPENQEAQLFRVEAQRLLELAED